MRDDLKLLHQLLQLIHLFEVGLESSEAAEIWVKILTVYPTFVVFEIELDKLSGMLLKEVRDSSYGRKLETCSQ